MRIHICRACDSEILALFLCEMNQQKDDHIGYCGDTYEEILDALEEDFIDHNEELTFCIVEDEGRIIAAIGLDIDEDSASAEVWGPFVHSTVFTRPHISLSLWQHLLEEFTKIQTFHFFVNLENKNVLSLMEDINAIQNEKHLVLKIDRNNFTSVKNFKSEIFNMSDFEEFACLHRQSFPNAYYDAKTILKRINEQQELRILKGDDGNIQGYAYFEVSQDIGEASIEFIAINPRCRNLGIGTKLLKEVINRIFIYESIESIQLCVSDTNKQANHVYHKAGFYTKNKLLSYTYRRS